MLIYIIYSKIYIYIRLYIKYKMSKHFHPIIVILEIQAKEITLNTEKIQV